MANFLLKKYLRFMRFREVMRPLVM